MTEIDMDTLDCIYRVSEIDCNTVHKCPLCRKMNEKRVWVEIAYTGGIICHSGAICVKCFKRYFDRIKRSILSYKGNELHTLIDTRIRLLGKMKLRALYG